ncbi:hypothetical protein DENSPDRAFT_859376 [Dentipellis sp. KUC8613]|nr:hypothetical protein DENSPDRAFT_859376 [Dentipellis sp. KUC8613]
MYFASLFALLASVSMPAFAQTGAPIVYNSAHNATPIGGSWSSGSKGVSTGPSFANPANLSFTYPNTTGVAYSFTEDGFYEISRYRFNSNGSQPNCITGIISWAHGKYTLNPNGSISMVPFGDGYMQVQDPCAAVSNFIQIYNFTELYQSWQIFLDPIDGPKLHLFQFDGTPVAPQFQVSTTPNMLPTQSLRNTTPPGADPDAASNSSRSAADPRLESGAGLGRLLAGLAAVSAMALAL